LDKKKKRKETMAGSAVSLGNTFVFASMRSISSSTNAHKPSSFSPRNYLLISFIFFVESVLFHYIIHCNFFDFRIRVLEFSVKRSQNLVSDFA